MDSQIAATNIGIIVLVGLVNLWMIMPLIFLAIVFYKFRHFYLETARDVKRLEATSIYSFINCLLFCGSKIIIPFSYRLFIVQWVLNFTISVQNRLNKDVKVLIEALFTFYMSHRAVSRVVPINFDLFVMQWWISS